MCEFCVKHGDGKRWYLRASNYADELLDDLRREKYIEEFIPHVKSRAKRGLKKIDYGRRFLPSLTRQLLTKKSKQLKGVHFGQVIPIEEVDSIMSIVGHIVRLPCVCRDVLLKREVHVCYLLAVSPDKMRFTEIAGRREESRPFIEGMERVSAQRAVAEMAALEKEGMIHTVWTFITPFIGAICNCDPHGCLALNFTGRGLQMFFPGEYLATADIDSCTGCGACLDSCLFSALSLDGQKRVTIDARLCRGCGICRRSCPVSALSLEPRKYKHPIEVSRRISRNHNHQ